MNWSKLHPESQMMSAGFDVPRASGSVKAPLYQTSTFAFESAEAGKAFFERAYGLRTAEADEPMGYIYSRIDNPTLALAEHRLCLWDHAEAGAIFSSGMAAITNVFLTHLQPGDFLLFSNPVYGGTDHFIRHYLPSIGINILGIEPGETVRSVRQRLEAKGGLDRLKMIFLETPANPTNDLFDIRAFSALADTLSGEERKVLLAVDNTFMGPLWQHPLKHGADLVVYSATKYIGGHSDLVAGFVLGNEELITQSKGMRAFIGNMADPHTAWLILRSLETLKVRMEQQAKNASVVADFLRGHHLVKKVHYLGHLSPEDRDYRIYQRQYEGPGAMISFEIKGGETEAFQFLNNLKLFKLAVSLGSTESLAQHPAAMTHAGMDPADKLAYGVGESLIRLSIGLEHTDDLVNDLSQALDKVKTLENWPTEYALH